MKTFFTIGYAGFAIDEFLEVLSSHNINCVIDIRELPISRKKGFAKSALRQRLISQHIQYEHFRELGSPTADRHRVRKTRDYSEFFRSVDMHFATPMATESLGSVAELALKRRCCLMCYCPTWQQCHRLLVVRRINAHGNFDFSHITRDAHTGRILATPHEDVAIEPNAWRIRRRAA